MAMRSIAVVNEKGGSGKTTTAVNLAAALGERDRRVLVVDLDPQASASKWYGVKEPRGRDLLDVLPDDGLDLTPIVRPTDAPGVYIVPSSHRLIHIDKALARQIGAEVLLRSKLHALQTFLEQEQNIVPLDAYWGELERDRVSFDSEQEAAEHYIKRIGELQRMVSPFDYIIIDCPPALGILTVNALAAAQAVLIPVEAHAICLNDLDALTGVIETVKARLQPSLRIAGILACRVNRTRHATAAVEQLNQRFPGLVCRTTIRENVSLAKCPSHGIPITQYATNSSGAQDYRALAEEVIGNNESEDANDG